MQNKTVIVADPIVHGRRQIVEAINAVAGLAVAMETGDGQELLRYCYENRCDVLVMDLVLASMDGLEVLERLCALRDKPKILVLSSFANGAITRLCMERGADHFMVKPCKCEAIVQRITQLALPTQLHLPRVWASAGVEAEIASILHEIGIPSHIKGYQYLREAIILTLEDRHAIDMVTKVLYPQIAKRHASTACGVERAIRHAIEIGWERGDLDTLHRFFGYTVSSTRGKPTNSEFIAIVSEMLELKTHASGRTS